MTLMTRWQTTNFDICVKNDVILKEKFTLKIHSYKVCQYEGQYHRAPKGQSNLRRPLFPRLVFFQHNISTNHIRAYKHYAALS